MRKGTESKTKMVLTCDEVRWGLSWQQDVGDGRTRERMCGEDNEKKEEEEEEVEEEWERERKWERETEREREILHLGRW